MNYLYKSIASVFGAGYSPIAPGTVGALVAGVFLYGLHFFAGFIFPKDFTSSPLFFGWLFVTLLVGVLASNKVEAEWGSDPSKVVIDEWVGMWLSVAFVPLTALNCFIGFILFRFFDIAKPLGVRRMERFPRGWGVMLDDVLAGVYANVVLQLILWGMGG